MRGRLLTAVVLLAGGGMVGFALYHRRAAPDFQEFVRTADRVELRFRPELSVFKPPLRVNAGIAEVTLPVPLKGQVGSILARVTLTAKDPCPCAHHEWLIFCKGQECLKTTVCDHCFDVIYRKNVYRFHMPGGLYEAVQEVEREYILRAASTQPASGASPTVD
jgi:hypothetical protein